MKYFRRHVLASVEFFVAHQLDVFIESVRARADENGFVGDEEMDDVIAFVREYTDTVVLPDARKQVTEFYEEMEREAYG